MPTETKLPNSDPDFYRRNHIKNHEGDDCRRDGGGEAVVAIIAALLAIIVVFAVVLFCSGCTSTVTPVVVAPQQASWDGNAQNSGEVAILADHSRLLTQHAEERYVALALVYGGRFQPRVTGAEAQRYILTTCTNVADGKVLDLPEAGGYWTLDAEHFAKFAIMNHYKRLGVK